ncbi:MAG: SusC/RagA family TonB-linked outer membrane protein, partial [Bacteroides sp.]|nr:SusC/RagA family TonB-linked outer membrane protein [Bacteroides sp.]
VGINAAHNRNVIKKLSNELKKMNEKNLSERNGTPPVYEEGQSTSVIKLVPSLGIDPATGKELFLTRDGEKTFVWDPKDKIAVGDTEPKIRGALTSSLTWKQLTAGLAFTYQLGADRVNETLINKIENAEISNNVDRRAGGPDRWSTTNRYAKYKGMGLYSQNTPSSTRFLQKYNEFALNSISVGYRLDPKQIKFLRTCRVASMSLTASMQDIFHFSTVKQERGLDYPYARSFNLSVSLLFN